MIPELEALTIVAPIWTRTVIIGLILLGITYIGLRCTLCVARTRD